MAKKEQEHHEKSKKNMKKILIWAGIAFIILITLSAIIDKSSGGKESGVKMGDTTTSEPEPEEDDVGITENEINQLGQELNDLEFDDLGGLAQ